LRATAAANTATRHQNPHLQVTVSLTPTKASVGDRLRLHFSVTNTGERPHSVSISSGDKRPPVSEGGGMSAITLAPHTTWSTTVHRRARAAGDYRIHLRASDRFGRSHHGATACAQPPSRPAPTPPPPPRRADVSPVRAAARGRSRSAGSGWRPRRSA